MVVTGDTNNVKRFCNKLHVSRPIFVDRMKNGYRVRLTTNMLGTDKEMNEEEVINRLKALGVYNYVYEVRVRGGYGYNSGDWDAIIKFANPNEKPLKYLYR